jgi:membrane protein required for beta-lactamase induction
MSFLAAFLALILDQFLRHLEPWRGTRWLHAYAEAFEPLARSTDATRATLATLFIVIVPAVVALFLGDVLDHIWLGLGFVYAVLVFLFCLGPKDLHDEALLYIDAAQAGDDARAKTLAADILEGAVPADPAERTEAVTRALLREANERQFGVLFWFAALGPAGAILYRSADALRRAPGREVSPEFLTAVARLHGVLAWIPAHLTALGYALAGSFEDAVSDLRGYYNTCTLHFFQVSNDVLMCAGLGALRAAAGQETGIVRLKSALALIRHTLFIWMAIYALITLLGWSW